MAGKKTESKATGIAAYYKLSGDKVTRTHKVCSRCGKGVFMSEHKNRRTCGKCGLTEFIQ
jgi:small subunit ribosomal protein S27Ae